MDEHGLVGSASTRAALPTDLPLAALVASAENPRHSVADAGMAGLVESIKANGIIQPLVVRPLAGAQERYEIIAGHRRYAAARAAGLATVPVRVIDGASSQQVHAMRIVENMQRIGLDPVEQAEALERLHAEEGLADAAIGTLVGKSRAWVWRTRALLELPRVVQDALRARRLSTAHGWALQRYRAFPALCERLALIAQRDGISCQAIDAPFVAADELARSGLIQSLAVLPPGFDRAQCMACPFKARFAPTSDDPGYCAKPAHYRQLAAEARRRPSTEPIPSEPVERDVVPARSSRRVARSKALIEALARADRLLERLSPAEIASAELRLLVRQHRGVLDRVIGPAAAVQDELAELEEGA